jgi:glucose/arabinose dehydrogenase
MKSLRKFVSLLLVILVIPSMIASAEPEAPPIGMRVRVRPMASGLTSPLTLVESPDGTRRLFIVDQVGLIFIMNQDGNLNPTPFLDLRDRIVTLNPNFDERGLLGLAFHPGYAENGRFFVRYSAPLREGGPEGWDNTATWSEFMVSADPNVADPNSEQILLQVDKPQFNHNGGWIEFGPDGYLYLGIGDGGGANDNEFGHVEDWYAFNEGGNGQDITHNLLGSILRIDVDNTDGMPYGIPADNPFVGTEALPEIYAYGFRNPYAMSFDKGGRYGLLVGDAGQNLWEEVDRVLSGGNYGWNVKEGRHCFSTADPFSVPANCPNRVMSGVDAGKQLSNPIIEYANAANPAVPGLGSVVVGGYVYRGRNIAGLQGKYVFGDWNDAREDTKGVLLMASPQNTGLWVLEQIFVTNGFQGRFDHYILGFGQDLAGEMYVMTTDMVGPSGTTGQVFKITKVP